MADSALIDKYLNELAETREIVLSMRDTAMIAENLKVRFADELPEIGFTMSAYSWFKQVQVTVQTDNFRKLVPVRRWLRARGLPAPKITDDPSTRTRKWDYGTIELRATLPMEGAACQYVQVGVKEVPEYKLVCPEVEPMPAVEGDGEDA
jgi:hypothetical protein